MERTTTYLNARPDASGYRTGNPVPMANGRHMFYHVIITEEQKMAVDASLRKLGIPFGREQTPMKFDITKKTIDNLQRTINREQSDQGHTRRLRQMEKETLEGIYDTCMYKMELLQKTAQREHPNDPSVFLNKNSMFTNFLTSTMAAIEGVQNKVRQEHDEYMRNKKLALDEEKKRTYLSGGRRYTTILPGRSMGATATATVIVKPKDEGAISALDLLGEDDDGEKEDEDTKDLPLMEGDQLAEGEAGDEQESATTSAQKSFREALAKSFQESDNGADGDGSGAPELEKFIDDDMKPPKLEAEVDDAGELPPPIRIPFLARRPLDGPLSKRPRILGHNGVTYKVVQPSGSMARFTPGYRGHIKIREQGEGRMTVADLNLNKVHSINTIAGLPVTLRPTSSTILPNDVRDRLIADGLTKHQGGGSRPIVPRVNSIIYRKDYKNPPTPLPADDGTHVLCHLCDNRIMCTRLSNLTNHVRRHSAAKQYQCAHCTYQHNEQAKVRLHMANNHDDETSGPVDNLTKDMQKVWEYLMDECFPGYLDQLKQTQPHSSALNWDRSGSMRSRGEAGPITLDDIHTCLECGEAISINSQLQKNLMITEPLVDHLKNEHKDLCIAQVCGECGYANVDEWKVRWHISARHDKAASDIPVNTAAEGEHMEIFLYKFFPSVENVVGPREDSDEAELKDAMGGNDTNATPTASVSRPSRISPAPEGLICKMEEDSSGSEEGFDKSLLKNSFPPPTNKIDVSQLTEKEVLCELCNKILIWENKNTLCTLLAHAKRHFKIKQFQCQICSYASSESQHVKQHMLQRHNEVGRPKEHNNEFMQNSWLSVMRKCFPLLRDRIDSFKFKTAKSQARQEREEREREKQGDTRERTPPSHGYATRRKRTFQS